MRQRRLHPMRRKRLVKTLPGTCGSHTLLCGCINIGRHKHHRNGRRGVNMLGCLDSIHIGLQVDIHQPYIRV
jgi:hypothetical protein